jgi:hypothetical protein
MWLLAASLASCGNCFGDRALEVGGETPYVRCLAASAPRSTTGRVGRVSWRIQGRALEVGGLPTPTRIAAFSGPGPGEPPDSKTWGALRAAKPDLILLLGDIGDTGQRAGTTLKGLAALAAPTLLLAGARDTRARIAEALAAVSTARERIIDVTQLREVRLSSDTFIPISGAASGSYARDSASCGYSLSDLKQVASDLDEHRAGRRWLLASQAPRASGNEGVARTSTGLDLGSPILGELAKRIGAPGGIFAWPHSQALRPRSAAHHGIGANEPAADLQLVVPRISGASLERDDGSRVEPGFALLRLGPEGLQLESESSPP